MESHLAAHDSTLLDALDFKPSGGAADYIIQRKDVALSAMSGNLFKSTGQRQLKFSLATEGWIEPSSIRLAFNLNNDHAADALQPLATPLACCFQRARLLSGGQVLEDIDNLGRTLTLWERLSPAMKKKQHANTGFTAPNSAYHVEAYDSIPAGDKKRTVNILPFGLFLQEKMLPGKYTNLCVELELAEPLAGFSGTAAGAAVWYLDDPLLLFTELQINSELESSFARFLLSGKSMPVYFTALGTSVHTIAGTSNSIMLARGYTRLKSALVSFWRSASAAAAVKSINTFYCHGNAAATLAEADDTISWRWQWGGKRMPERDCQGQAENAYRLQIGMGVHVGPDSIAPTPYQMHSNSYIQLMDFEKAGNLGAKWSGLNTKESQSLVYHYAGLGGATAASAPDTCYIVMAYDACLNIRGADGAEVLD